MSARYKPQECVGGTMDRSEPQSRLIRSNLRNLLTFNAGLLVSRFACNRNEASADERGLAIKGRNPITPREWFLVPVFVIDEAVDRIKDGTITEYIYDPKTARLVRRESGG